MRKFRNVALAGVVVASIVGCGGGGGGGPGGNVAPPSSPSNPSANTAPTIQGVAPGSIVAGQAYSFQPSASDANGDTLTFTASNLPPWASIDASTGRVSGTPNATQVGTYSNITIQVSDGKATTTLAAFSITVSAITPGSALISWTAPTINTDGTALVDLAGYELRYGRDPGQLDQSVSITTVGITSYLVPNLSPGTWYFAIAATNTAGVAGQASQPASKVIS